MRAAPRRAVLAVSFALCALPALASPVQTMNRAQLQALLATETPCCVIDARSESERAKLDLAHALLYRADMKINPTGWVIVIADSDERARRVGEALATTNAARHVAVAMGGAQTWLDAQQILQGGPAGVLSFIIPRNTCEQGPALQVLPARRP